MSATEGLLQIGEVAATVGLSLRTVRYYEEIGLVVPSARTDGGFRLYSESDVQRLITVKRMKPLGLSLEEMADLLDVIEQCERPDLPARELATLGDRLQQYATGADERIDRLEHDLAEARALRLRMSELLGRCRQSQEAERVEA